MNLVGIKQGRLSPRPYPALQAFPWNTWEMEFAEASKIGYDFIEWMFDAEDYSKNPLWTIAGRERIRNVARKSGTPVLSICADYFLARPFYREQDYTFQENIDILKKLVSYATEVGANLVLLPVLETSAIQNELEENRLISALLECVPILEDNKVHIGLETDLPGNKCLELCQKIGSKQVGIYYDTGNCASYGHNLARDLNVLGSHVLGVHIKDRLLGGGSVFLRAGDADIQGAIHTLANLGYSNNFTLEAYYEDDPIGTASANLQFIRQLMDMEHC